jgi:uridine kinase
MLCHLADAVGSKCLSHPVRVAVDGPPAAGKTTLADELADVLRERGHHVIRATIEGFLFTESIRYERGPYSAEGCYLDNHNYSALNRVLLDPLGPGGDRQFRRAIYDRTTDTNLEVRIETARVDAVLVFDGVFLMRPELFDQWDLRIFVSTPFEQTVDRALLREQGAGSAADIERRWRERYIPSQRLYFATVNPIDRADIVVHNDDPRHPSWEHKEP